MPRRPISDDEEMEDVDAEVEENDKGTNGMQAAVNGNGELAYDPDQKVEDKRRLRAQYRQLLGEQDGMYALDASKLCKKGLTPTGRTSRRYGKPNHWPDIGESEIGRQVF